MPRLHRQVVALIAGGDKGTVPTSRPRERFAVARRRCENPACDCVLARDNPGPYCSPCHRRIARTHGDPGAYLTEKPRR